MSSDNNDAVKDHLLLTVLGTNSSKACYSLGGQTTEAKLAPIALLKLLQQEERPSQIMAICTPEAKNKSWPILKEELDNNYHLLDPVCVSNEHTQEGINSYITLVSKAVKDKPDLTLDITHGYRHFSFLTYMVVLYLAALRRVQIKGAYYGLLQDGKSPFLDLRPLLELPRWLNALEVVHNTGSTLPMAKAISNNSPGSFGEEIKRDLSHFSQAYLSGLPLELGYQTHQLQKKYKPLKKELKKYQLPLVDELVNQLEETFKHFAMNDLPLGEGWKGQVTLSEEELKRQAKVIDSLLKQRNFTVALGLMNEWTVSWVVLRHYNTNQWLDYKTARRRASCLLGTIGTIEKDVKLRNILTDKQCSLGKFWRSLCQLRNSYHHHGMRDQILVNNMNIDQELCSVRKFWEKTLCLCPEFSLSLGESLDKSILVIPIGKRPGVLFSALQACRTQKNIAEPAMCFIICSPETERSIDKALECADYGGETKPLLLKDAYGGYEEIEHLQNEVRSCFIGASEVIVNVTGGTTLMGLTAEALADTASKLACPVRRFGLIDRRPPEQQDADPYQSGEPFWFGPMEDDNDSKY